MKKLKLTKIGFAGAEVLSRAQLKKVMGGDGSGDGGGACSCTLTLTNGTTFNPPLSSATNNDESLCHTTCSNWCSNAPGCSSYSSSWTNTPRTGS